MQKMARALFFKKITFRRFLTPGAGFFKIPMTSGCYQLADVGIWI
jgi:hypothetical protein